MCAAGKGRTLHHDSKSSGALEYHRSILSFLPVAERDDNRQVHHQQCVLAVRSVWSDLESGEAGAAEKGMAAVMTVDRALVESLRELVAALDRRVPHLERSGELEIARASATLRDEAVRRLAELEQADVAGDRGGS